MDSQVGKILDELEKSGLSENTIVLYASDHGGILPRGKRYLEETGIKVPLIIRIPKKFQHLSPFEPGQRVDEPVSFVDLSPTFLSLAGAQIPTYMQGRPFLGEKRVKPAADEMEFLYADRFDELYGMRRGLTDGKWKYIRNFNPHLPNAPFSFYQFGQPCWTAYQKAWQEGKLDGIHQALWQRPSPTEQLYDLTTDPWETKNLAADPTYSEKLSLLRQRLKSTMTGIRDTGFIPEPLFGKLSADSTIADHVQNPAFDIQKIADLAFSATAGNLTDIPILKAAITSQDVVTRYWGATGFCVLGPKAASESNALTPLLKDNNPVIRITAAEAIFSCGDKKTGSVALLADTNSDMDESSLLYLLNTLRRLKLTDQLPKDWVIDKSKKGGYVQRFIKE